ncbi:hypothetical protein [Streptomyces justiciae]|uniref:hypothetical protein n=1 Tax=Streptomyces justiciae TaxID=2780140 RepID=UPI001880A126|nr:hypothetical protein [Streptomyces justiciae]MBE8476916.1 hypothetical protein [Streptomyces justiciae]MCW8379670.1 hypothetical protein [Streptomyces justiciae]
MPSSAPTARTARLLAALTVVLAVFTLTACEDGEGLRDEGPSSSTSTSPAYDDDPSPSSQASPPSGNS